MAEISEDERKSFAERHGRGYYSGSSTDALNFGKIFGYMTLAVIITSIFAGLFGLLFWHVMGCTSEIVGGLQVITIANPDSLFWITMLSILPMIGLVVSSVMAGAFSMSGRQVKSRSVVWPFLSYAICIGYFFGLIVLFAPWEAIAMSLGITVLIYAVLALIGALSKGNMNPVMYVASSLCTGAFLLIGMNFLLIWFIPSLGTMTYWLVTMMTFGALMLSTIWDVWHIKLITKSAEMTPNLTLFCAFRLYVDFIAIFIRVLYFILVIFGRNRE